LRWSSPSAAEPPGRAASSPARRSRTTRSPRTLKVDGICWDNGTNTFAAAFIETTQDGARSQGYFNEGKTPVDVTDGPVRVSEDIAENDSASDSFLGPDDGSWAAENAAETTVIDGFGNQAVPNLSGGTNATCSFSGYVVDVTGS
jgi:hypothetical protein